MHITKKGEVSFRLVTVLMLWRMGENGIVSVTYNGHIILRLPKFHFLLKFTKDAENRLFNWINRLSLRLTY